MLLVGDAAGYIDALTGEGMGLAFGAAELLVDCVVRERPEDYDGAHSTVISPILRPTLRVDGLADDPRRSSQKRRACRR